MDWEAFSVPDALIRNTRARLRRQEAIFPIASDPLFASLVSCLGLRFEIGRPGWDRLSAAFGIDPADAGLWRSELIGFRGQIGIRAWLSDNRELVPRHEDFREILHPLSLDPATSRLSQLVVFP